MNRKKIITQEEKKGGVANWLTTFNDLMTLLMVFFVLLFTMGSVDIKKVKDFQGALQSALGVLYEGKMVAVPGLDQKKSIKDTDNAETDALNFSDEDIKKLEIQMEASNISEMLKDSIEALETESEVKMTRTKEGLLITLRESLLFGSGIAKINPGGYPILNKINSVLQNTSKPVRVEGHTDNNPIHTKKFPSNWELSTTRAVNVIKYFISVGEILPRRLSAVGYGESKPLFPNDIPENKAKNRRVEIVLVDL